MSYEFRQPYVSATLRLMPKRRHWTLAGGLEWTAWDQRPGDGPSPSVDTRFTPPTLPGLGADVTYVHSQATASFDRRPFAGYARRGGYYGVTATTTRTQTATAGSSPKTAGVPSSTTCRTSAPRSACATTFTNGI